MCGIDSTVSEYSTWQVLPGAPRCTAPPSRSCSTGSQGRKTKHAAYRGTTEYNKDPSLLNFQSDGADKNGALRAPSSVLPSLQCKHNHDQIRSSPVQSTWQSNPLLCAVGQLHIVISPRQVLPHIQHYACRRGNSGTNPPSTSNTQLYTGISSSPLGPLWRGLVLVALAWPFRVSDQQRGRISVAPVNGQAG